MKLVNLPKIKPMTSKPMFNVAGRMKSSAYGNMATGMAKFGMNSWRHVGKRK